MAFKKRLPRNPYLFVIRLIKCLKRTDIKINLLKKYLSKVKVCMMRQYNKGKTLEKKITGVSVAGIKEHDT